METREKPGLRFWRLRSPEILPAPTLAHFFLILFFYDAGDQSRACAY
jgi:hypothetical protein